MKLMWVHNNMGCLFVFFYHKFSGTVKLITCLSYLAKLSKLQKSYVHKNKHGISEIYKKRVSTINKKIVKYKSDELKC